ncbi:kelch repeat-containing protein [Candidatus Binatus sp.]|uniref:kelch repeat-containing protein n=1 Tax=Candidatus Binatus sp. TaxID=2811406 RepID=UPI003C87A74D
MIRSASLVAALLLMHLIFAGIAFAESTVSYPEHVDHPELYVLPAPAKKNIEILIYLKRPVTDDDIQPFSDWLTDGGFQIIDADTKAGYLHISGSVEDAADAFQTQIMMTREGSYGNLSDPKIPARFASVVRAISGLTEVILAPYVPIRPAQPVPTQPHSRNTSSLDSLQSHTFFLSNGVSAFGPADEQTFYDAASLISSGINGSSVDCIALTEDSTFTAAAVTNFNSTFMLPQFGTSPALTTVLVGTGQTENSDETEALIDIEWAHALAPMANIHVYISAQGSSNVQVAIEKVITDNVCGTIDISQTLCGSELFFELLGNSFQLAAQQRQAVFVSTGDDGAAEFTVTSGACPSLAAGIKELAASPYVTAVGGTMFTPTYNANGNDVGSVAEMVWNDISGASGGGVSQVFPEPAYQAQQVLPASAFRAIPDLSLGASPNTPGFWIVNAMNGTPTPLQQYGGTSLASPAWAGIGALLADQAKERVGNINSRLYQMSPLAASVGIRDVTAGNNTFGGVTGVSAGVGYDEASGWGTPDVTRFVNAFAGEALISGGLKNGTVLATAETFDPEAKKYTATGNMSHARMCHTSTLLSNGQTLVAGGTKNLTGGSLASAELFTPSTRKFVATAGPLMVARYEHQAVLLNNGTVLVMGGFTGDSLKDVTNSAELYNPAAGGSFSLTGVMSVARGS